MSHHNLETIENEIKDELQLERMILFSDAVFAIVITLMAIELRLPEFDHKLLPEEWKHVIKHLISVFAAYVVSFFFIGIIWYRHLKMFSLLKDYDGGLVVRNMLLLFFIGLFPFGASIASTPSESILPFATYAAIVILCLSSQFALQYYILIQRPQLRNDRPIEIHLKNLYLSRVLVIGLGLCFTLLVITYQLLEKENKIYSFLWLVLFVITVRIARKKYKSKI